MNHIDQTSSIGRRGWDGAIVILPLEPGGGLQLILWTTFRFSGGTRLGGGRDGSVPPSGPHRERGARHTQPQVRLIDWFNHFQMSKSSG